MKLATSYFYQIRNFKNYMIPVSTAMFDPVWFHKNDMNGVYKDKNNVYNGIRFEELAPGKSCNGLCKGTKICKIKNPKECEFLKQYEKQLENLNIENLIKKCNILANNIKRIEGFYEEPIIVFIVYESYTNECSERNTILSMFNKNNIEISELKYPIQENY